jgi:MFS family permease
LFLQLWSFRDWEVNARPFIYLAFTAIAVPDERIGKLCKATALMAAAGLAVALIGSLIGPIAILVQGQAWRWVWICVFVSAVLFPLTALQVWRDQRCGPLCAILLLSGWTLPAVNGTACASLALALWLMREKIGARAAPYLRWASVALGIAVTAWVLVKSWAIFSAHTGRAPLAAAQIRDIFGLRITAVLIGTCLWWWIRSSRTLWISTFLSVLCIALSIFVLPASFKQIRVLASASDSSEFSEWTNIIPLTSTVLVTPSHDVGGFVWFTLERPNYLALDQSAGVVFSRATALEVQRRSQVLLPLMDPDWKILTHLRTASGSKRKDDAARPLSAESLTQICADPLLGFVISPQNVGYDPVRHEHAGIWKDWNLYDCRKVRPAPPST